MGKSNSTNTFDSLAATWDANESRVKSAKNIVEKLHNFSLLPDGCDALDYGCGTGILSLAMAERAKKVLGMDFSQGMLDVLSKKIFEAGIKNVSLQRHNIEEESLPTESFDLVVSSMALHHITRPANFFIKSHKALKQGGAVFVADLDSEEGDFHPPEMQGVRHFGFEREHILTLMSSAGFEKIQIETLEILSKNQKSYPIFFAFGFKL